MISMKQHLYILPVNSTAGFRLLRSKLRGPQNLPSRLQYTLIRETVDLLKELNRTNSAFFEHQAAMALSFGAMIQNWYLVARLASQ